MLRFPWLIFYIFVTIQADDPQQQTDLPIKNEGIEKQLEGFLESVNGTLEKPNQLTKEYYDQIMRANTTDFENKSVQDLVRLIEQRHFQVAEQFVSQASETNEKFSELQNVVDRRLMQVSRDVVNQASATNHKLDDLKRLVEQRHNQISVRDEKAVKENLESVKDFNERFNDLEKQNIQILAQLKKMEESRNSDRNKLDGISKFVQRHLKLFEITFPEAQCKIARSANLKKLSNNKQYYFSVDIQANWTVAKEICAGMGLQLATMADQRDADAVAEESGKTDAQGWWLSARKTGGQKDYIWLDGTKLELDSTMWNTFADKDTNCIYIYNWSNGKLSNTHCGWKYYNFVCELPRECYVREN